MYLPRRLLYKSTLACVGKLSGSPKAFNLKNISSKFENPDYKFNLKGLKSVKDADVYLRLKAFGLSLYLLYIDI